MAVRGGSAAAVAVAAALVWRSPPPRAGHCTDHRSVTALGAMCGNRSVPTGGARRLGTHPGAAAVDIAAAVVGNAAGDSTGDPHRQGHVMFAVPPDRRDLRRRGTDPAEAPNGSVDIPELSPRYAGSRGQNRTDAWSANRCPPPDCLAPSG